MQSPKREYTWVVGKDREPVSRFLPSGPAGIALAASILWPPVWRARRLSSTLQHREWSPLQWMRVHCPGSPGYPRCRIAFSSWLDDTILIQWSCWGISQGFFTSLKYSCWKRKVVSNLNSAWPWQTFTLSWAEAIRPLHINIWETFWCTEYSWRLNVWAMTLPESQCPWPLTTKPLRKASTNPGGWDGNTQVTVTLFHWDFDHQVNCRSPCHCGIRWNTAVKDRTEQKGYPATVATSIGQLLPQQGQSWFVQFWIEL